MALRHVGYVELPPHLEDGAFDHAAVHHATGLVYVAHTANAAVDVIDMATQKHVGSVHGLPRVAGALVSDEHDLVFTSNRGENTGGGVSPGPPAALTQVPVGSRTTVRAEDTGR